MKGLQIFGGIQSFKRQIMNNKKIFLPFIGILMLSLFALQSGLSINDGVLDIHAIAMDDHPPEDEEDDGFFILRHRLIVGGVASTFSKTAQAERQQHIAQVLARYHQ